LKKGKPFSPSLVMKQLWMAAGVKPGGGHNNTPAPDRVETTRHPHLPPMSGIKFPHTRHPRG
jgi:hypothetical protein